jgi:flavin-dependent dehydrogenase
MYDAIIIGARCAGSPTAMLLARKGYKVLLLDRASFPSDTISTHIILLKGVAKLKKWDLADKIISSGCPVIHHLAFDLGPIKISASPPPLNGTSEVMAPRRIILDKILVDAAVDAGAELRDNSTVEEILMENGRVTGVRCRTKNGTEWAEKARIVIGADGKNSLLARTVQAEEYNNHPKMTCWYYAYWSGVPVEALTLYSPPNRAIGIIPTNDDLCCIPVSWPIGEFHEYRSNIEGNYMKTFELVAGLPDIMKSARRETAFTGMADLPGFFRKPYGPGWALAGDAGYHKDPITGQGISDAMTQADELAEALDTAWSGKGDIDELLASYHHARDTEVTPMYHFTCDFASLAPPTPEMELLFNALSTNQEAANSFSGTLAGSVPVNEFFAPENVERIIGASEKVNP